VHTLEGIENDDKKSMFHAAAIYRVNNVSVMLAIAQ